MVTELQLGAEASIGSGLSLIFRLELSSEKRVFRLLTKDPIQIRSVMEFIGDQFGFRMPELPSIAGYRPWDALYKKEIRPSLAFSPGQPRYLEGALAFTSGIDI